MGKQIRRDDYRLSISQSAWSWLKSPSVFALAS
jgi:hypothetical protein